MLCRCILLHVKAKNKDSGFWSLVGFKIGAVTNYFLVGGGGNFLFFIFIFIYLFFWSGKYREIQGNT